MRNLLSRKQKKEFIYNELGVRQQIIAAKKLIHGEELKIKWSYVTRVFYVLMEFYQN